jgi:hypothetical protein
MRDCLGWNKRRAGNPTGRPNETGYLETHLTWNGSSSLYKTHRIIWALAYGVWPFSEIDHINGIIDDNRLANLREAPHREAQLQNQKRHANNASGYPGVNQDRGRWRARIRINGHLHSLGHYGTPQEAFWARCDAKARFHQFQPLHRDLTEEQTNISAFAWFRRQYRQFVRNGTS